MSGYFPRLMHMTGVRPGGGGNFLSDRPESSRTESPTGNETPPIHVEETKPVDPPADHEAEPVHEVSGTSSQPPVPDARQDSTAENRGEGRFRTDLPLEPDKVPTTEVESTGPQISGKTARPPDRQVVESDTQTSPRRSPDQPEIVIETSSNMEEVHKSTGFHEDASGAPAALPDSPRTTPADRQAATLSTKDRVPFELATKPGDRVEREEPGQVTFQDIREWVAVTPDAEEKSTRGALSQKIAKTEEELPRTIVVHQEPATQHPAPPARKDMDEIGIHDFHLSIGTISVTVEDSRQPGRPAEARPPQPKARKPSGDDTSSRLARKYIRMG